MYKYDKMMEKFEQELDAIQSKIASGTDITDKDLERADKLAHTLKSLVCYCEKKEELEAEEPGMSGRRGRAMNGRFVSRDAGTSYAEGYSQGYSAAMRHYPPDYYTPNDWPVR